MSNSKRTIHISTGNRKYISSNNDPEKEDKEQSGPTPSSSRLLTMKQVTGQLQLSRATIYRLIAREQFPVLHFGRTVRVDPAALQQWLARRTHH
jgi:excisionase family DNA binding protein